MIFSFSLSFSLSLVNSLFKLYSLSLRVLFVNFHPSDSEEFLYRDDRSDIAHDISAEASVSHNITAMETPLSLGPLKT